MAYAVGSVPTRSEACPSLPRSSHTTQRSCRGDRAPPRGQRRARRALRSAHPEWEVLSDPSGAKANEDFRLSGSLFRRKSSSTHDRPRADASADAVEQVGGMDLQCVARDLRCRGSARVPRVLAGWLTRIGTARPDNLSGTVRPTNPHVIPAVGLEQTVSVPAESFRSNCGHPAVALYAR